MSDTFDFTQNGVTKARREPGFYWARFPRGARIAHHVKPGPPEVAQYVVDSAGNATWRRVGRAGLWEEAWVGPAVVLPDDVDTEKPTPVRRMT